ncbi:hypothetical protein EC988_010256, partial [Linderina pennispora]
MKFCAMIALATAVAAKHSTMISVSPACDPIALLQKSSVDMFTASRKDDVVGWIPLGYSMPCVIKEQPSIDGCVLHVPTPR